MIVRSSIVLCLSCLAFKRATPFILNWDGQQVIMMRRSLMKSSSVNLSATIACSTSEEKVVKDMLYRIRQVNYMPEEIKESLIPFHVDKEYLGKVRPKVVDTLLKLGNNVFVLDKDQELTLEPSVAGSTCESRSEAVMTVMEKLREEGIVTGWRDELYPMTTSFYSDPIFVMERAATPILGGLEYGVHMNGLVKLSGGSGDEDKMWMARRSKTKSKYPSMMDHLVAGGQPVGAGLFENAIKECEEEAGVPADLAKSGLKAAGAISYETYEPNKDVISRAVLFCYDLWLPEDFDPVAMDGEVEEFFLWSIDEVKQAMDPECDDPIKPNCYPVIIDYLLRAGHLSPDSAGYLDILRELRSGELR